MLLLMSTLRFIRFDEVVYLKETIISVRIPIITYTAYSMTFGNTVVYLGTAFYL